MFRGVAECGNGFFKNAISANPQMSNVPKGMPTLRNAENITPYGGDAFSAISPRERWSAHRAAASGKMFGIFRLSI